LRHFLLHRTSARQRRWGAAPWPAAWAAPSRSKGPHLANHQLLRDLDVERNLFCPLTVAEMDGGRLATRRHFGQSSTAVGHPLVALRLWGQLSRWRRCQGILLPAVARREKLWSSGAAARWLALLRRWGKVIVGVLGCSYL
jgi:hypothetical protein